MVDDERNQRLIERYEAFMCRLAEEREHYLGMLGFNWQLSPRTHHGEILGHPLVAPDGLSITLHDGRVIALREWHQYFVYAGTLCGVPPTPENDIIAALKTARRMFSHLGARPVLLEPEIHQATYQTARGEETKLQPLIWLPKVGSVALFESGSPARDPEEVYSSLVVVWFQERYGLPEDVRVFDQLRSLDWNAYAVDSTP